MPFVQQIFFAVPCFYLGSKGNVIWYRVTNLHFSAVKEVVEEVSNGQILLYSCCCIETITRVKLRKILGKGRSLVKSGKVWCIINIFPRLPK
jgi:hypothetical protein